jgi:triosephosphate isomerase (TIM)
MRKPIVAGNWKMYGSRTFVADLLSHLKDGLHNVSNIEVIVFPPYVFLEQTQTLLADSKMGWGAQNVYQAVEGPFTGEISPRMLKEFGCSYVIVGHSERRHLMGETNDQVAEKFLLAANNGLSPILCVGETREQRESDQTFDTIMQQLLPILKQPDGIRFLSQGVIAYEPVWAIGTGLTATPDQTQEVHKFIRQEVEKFDKTLAEKLRILYGGSVKQNNAAALFAMPDIDGGLIGGASLNPKEFLEIAKLCNCC